MADFDNSMERKDLKKAVTMKKGVERERKERHGCENLS